MSLRSQQFSAVVRVSYDLRFALNCEVATQKILLVAKDKSVYVLAKLMETHCEGRKQNEKTETCLTLQICQFGIQGTCGHQCNAKCQILMVRSQLVPNRHQRRWPLIMHLPNVDMPIGHQHIHLPLRQIDSVGHRKLGQWIDACVRPAFQLLVAEDMSAKRSMSMTHWWQSPQAEWCDPDFSHVPVACWYKETGPAAFLLSSCSCEACKPCKGYVGPYADMLQASSMAMSFRQQSHHQKPRIS